MRKANCGKGIICQRLAEMQLSEHDRQLARYALRDAEAIMHGVIWITERFAALGAMLPKLGFRH